jgi:Fibronectin type III domain
VRILRVICSPKTDKGFSRTRVFNSTLFVDTERVVRKSSCWLQKFGVGIVLVSLFGCCIAKALSSIPLDWNPNTDPSVAGYNVYYGNASRSYTSVTNVGNTSSAVIGGLVEGRAYYFAVTAYTFDGFESDYSDEIVYVVPGRLTITQGASPSSPIQIRFPVSINHSYELQVSADLKTWSTIWTTTGAANDWAEFDVMPTSLGAEYFRVIQH